MATVDTSIYAQFGARPVSFAESMREFAQMEDDKISRKGNKLALLINEQKYADMQRDRERGNALQSILGAIPAEATTQDRMMALRKGGFHSEADALYRTDLENREKAGKAEYEAARARKEQLDTGAKQLDLMLQVISAAKDQASYSSGLQLLASNGLDISSIPPQFDPAYVQNAGQWAMTALQRVNSERQAAELRLQQERAAEEVRHNRKTEENTRRGQDLSYSATVRGQDMTDARAKTTGSPAANVTEGERNASGYALRMDEATKLLEKFEKSGKGSYTTQAIGAIPLVGDALQRAAMSPEQQQYKQAADDWIRAKLRKESGAVIGEQEMQAEYRTYFPIPGDSPEVIQQKREARAVASQAMRNAAGRAAPSSQPSQPKVVDFGSLK